MTMQGIVAEKPISKLPSDHFAVVPGLDFIVAKEKDHKESKVSIFSVPDMKAQSEPIPIPGKVKYFAKVRLASDRSGIHPAAKGRVLVGTETHLALIQVQDDGSASIKRLVDMADCPLINKSNIEFSGFVGQLDLAHEPSTGRPIALLCLSGARIALIDMSEGASLSPIRVIQAHEGWD